MIEQLRPSMILNPPNPVIIVKERAYLDCGCQVFVGLRTDNQETATMAASCCPEHDQLVNHFNMLLQESTVDPLDEPLVDVCERLLEQAERYS